jgi:tryptophanyl-tRNA synthetase
VGDDQTQHVELARDIAIRFNHRFGDTLVVPKATVPPYAARVKDLQRPEAKMSKSVESPQGTLGVLDPPAAITKKIKSAVTDSGTEVRFDPAEKPGVSNLLAIYAAATRTTVEAAEAEFAGSQYGAFKSTVADAVVELLTPVRERYEELAADRGEVARILAEGAAKAEAIASATMDRVRRATGLLPPRG